MSKQEEHRLDSEKNNFFYQQGVLLVRKISNEELLRLFEHPEEDLLWNHVLHFLEAWDGPSSDQEGFKTSSVSSGALRKILRDEILRRIAGNVTSEG